MWKWFASIYFKEQLISDVAGVTEYSKAAKKLFRRLYREDEKYGVGAVLVREKIREVLKPLAGFTHRQDMLALRIYNIS